MDLKITPDWFEKMAEREGDLEIGAGFMPRLRSLPPAYGGCRCSCHRIAGMLHVMACCHPTKDDEDLERLLLDADLRRLRRQS